MRKELGADSRPGIVVSVATSGDLLQWHAHLHILVTDGAFSDDGTFQPLVRWNTEALMRLFRERLLARLVDKHAISQLLATKLNQSCEDAPRRALPLRHTAESDVEGRSSPHHRRRRLL